MGIRKWIGDMYDPNNMNPRILILLIVILITIFVLIMSDNLTGILMLFGILLISLDKIFTKTWLINRSAQSFNQSKIRTIKYFWELVLHFGIIDNYLGLIGTGMLIASTILEIYKAFIMDKSMMSSIVLHGNTTSISTDCLLLIIFSFGILKLAPSKF